MVQSHMSPFRNLGTSFIPHLAVSFGRDTKSLLSGVYDREVKYPTQGVNV